MNISAHIDLMDSNETSLIVHGYPLNFIEAQFIRLKDNSTEIFNLTNLR